MNQIDNDKDNIQILHALYEALITSHSYIPKNLEEAITEEIDSKSVWTIVIRFIGKHIREIITATEDKPFGHHDRIIIYKKESKDIQSFGERPDEDNLPPALHEKWKNFLKRKSLLHFGDDPPVLSISDNKPFPLAVKLHPTSKDHHPLLIYLFDPSPEHPIYSTNPVYIGMVIWQAAQQVLFNRYIQKYILKLEQEFTDAIARQDVEKIIKCVQELWPMYCITEEPSGVEKNSEILNWNQKNPIKKFRYKLMSVFAMKFLQIPSKKLHGFADGMKNTSLLYGDDLKILDLAYMASGERFELDKTKDEDVITKFLITLFLVRDLKHKWVFYKAAERTDKWDYIKSNIDQLCLNATKLLEETLLNPVKQEITIQDDWTRAYLSLLVVRAVKNEEINNMLGSDISLFGLDLAEHLVYVVMVSLQKYMPSFEEDTDLWYDPVTYTESLINIMAWYAHKVIGVDVELPIADTLKRIFESEASLYSLKPYYRDHLYHVIDVCMLGHLLLSDDMERIFKIDEMELKTCLKQWYVASIFHDVGYIVELVSSSLKALKDIGSPEIDEFSQKLSTAYQTAEEHYCHRLFCKVDKARERCVLKGLDHGTTSASHLQHLLAGIRDGENEYRQALDAIIAHNIHPNYPVRQKEAPVTALLILCDELQEWGRPSIESSKFLRHIAATRNLGEYPLKRYRPLEKLTIKKTEDNKIEFILEYFPPDKGLFDTARVWFSKVSNFERVEWDAGSGNWNIEIKVPVSAKYKELGLFEMDLLRKCAWNHFELSPIRRWIQLAEKQEWYNKNEEKAEEILNFPLHLDQLTEKFFLTNPGVFNALGDYQTLRDKELITINERLLAKQG
ncbi:MAG: hypothetical protein GY795_19245 [Desulfobacterales bacterium]|nr:hypothetical protein [Desulfobacterales bacterium]